ncbi:glutamate--tRNA ligase [Dissulfurirhabdus thermomarina]|uniref:Glutamate--tRNA ligase n=1 Tax=Dissulfurirhabdus thermomarina TaxID=1765737 RepID=A0A6N9TPF0_DISTH|nr:glutamate--tRNA ligase [Dissulfurirhabdus thermomarina]NDY41973.1 glutamate--tRNA ligase [Dissulfurirhabdus thermomarina]NMX22804.1 glutamate--tRNA ligase [Dissulfurirhabdus thermomarina]
MTTAGSPTHAPVRVRFAPSPTGYLHIGGARTAIYNWLFARRHGGTFILRIEDTDAERSTQDSIRGIIDGLTWLGIDWDVGPDFQSRHIAEHRAAAERLLASGHAYRCFCTKEELDAKREAARAAKRPFKYDGTCRNLPPEEVERRVAAGWPSVIRFRVPEGEGAVRFDDVVYGPIERAWADIEDFVIVRSNGTPLYLLSNAVDDIRDGITHVIRGQDGLANTPRQILIYQALGAPLPVFAHMPLTLDLQKRKISKRTHGEVVAVQFYRERGFLPWALVNFLVLLGWHVSGDQEIFSREELLEAFSLEGIGRANSIFNYRPGDPKFFTDPKALSINAHYLRTLPVEEIAPHVKAELEAAGIWDPAWEGERREWFLATVDLIRSRYHTLKDFVELGRAYFSDDFPVDEKALRKNVLKHEALREWLPELADRLAGVSPWTPEATEAAVRAFAEEKGIKAGVVINGIRTAVTGQAVGPGLFDVLAAVGQERTVARLRRVPALYGG